MVIEYKKGQIFYEVNGKGEPLLLLHGFLENTLMWNPFIPQLIKTNKVITIDLLGHGKSSCLGYIHTMEDMANSVKAVLNHLQLDKIKIIGHSMGGYVALALEKIYPNLVSDLCLLNSTFLADNKERTAIRERAIEMAKHQYKNLVRMSFSNLFTAESLKIFKTEYQNALQEALKTSVQGYVAAQRGMMKRENLLDVFNSIPGKKEMVLGEKDGLIDVEKHENIIKGSSIKITTFNAGHMSHIENTADLSKYLVHFVE